MAKKKRPNLAERWARRPEPKPLAKKRPDLAARRKQAVIDLIRGGMPVQEIAIALRLSLSTIKRHHRAGRESPSQQGGG